MCSALDFYRPTVSCLKLEQIFNISLTHTGLLGFCLVLFGMQHYTFAFRPIGHVMNQQSNNDVIHAFLSVVVSVF